MSDCVLDGWVRKETKKDKFNLYKTKKSHIRVLKIIIKRDNIRYKSVIYFLYKE